MENYFSNLENKEEEIIIPENKEEIIIPEIKEEIKEEIIIPKIKEEIIIPVKPIKNKNVIPEIKNKNVIPKKPIKNKNVIPEKPIKPQTGMEELDAYYNQLKDSSPEALIEHTAKGFSILPFESYWNIICAGCNYLSGSYKKLKIYSGIGDVMNTEEYRKLYKNPVEDIVSKLSPETREIIMSPYLQVSLLTLNCSTIAKEKNMKKHPELFEKEQPKQEQPKQEQEQPKILYPPPPPETERKKNTKANKYFD